MFIPIVISAKIATNKAISATLRINAVTNNMKTISVTPFIKHLDLLLFKRHNSKGNPLISVNFKIFSEAATALFLSCRYHFKWDNSLLKIILKIFLSLCKREKKIE
jgi:hypothetical protein